MFQKCSLPNGQQTSRVREVHITKVLETDLTSLESFNGNKIILKQLLDTCSDETIKMAKALSCIWGEIKAGHIFLRSSQEAMQVVGCMERRSKNIVVFFLCDAPSIY